AAGAARADAVDARGVRVRPASLAGRADRALAVRIAHLVGAAAGARRLRCSVDARRCPRRARGDAVGTRIRVAGARLSRGAGGATAAPVTDHAGAAGSPGLL